MAIKSALDTQLEKLATLYAFDSRLDEIEIAKKVLPKKLASAEIPILEKKAVLAKLTGDLEAFQAQKKALEKTISTQNDHKQNTHDRMLSVKSNEAYQAGLREIDTAEKIITESEDTLLEVMEKLETLQSRCDALEDEISVVDKSLDALRSEVVEALETAEKQRESLEQDRPQHLEAITDKNILAIYESVRKKHSDALSQTNSDFCGACQMTIPQQTLNLVRRNENLQQCPSCRRILVWKGSD